MSKHSEFPTLQEHQIRQYPTFPTYPPYPVAGVPVAGGFPTAPPSYDEATNVGRPFVVPPPGSGANVPPQPPPTYIPQPTPTAVFAIQFGPNRAHVRCPACSADVLTRTAAGPSCIAHLCCLLLALLQCYLCSCLPYCMDSLQTVSHYCPNCNTYLGKYEP